MYFESRAQAGQLLAAQVVDKYRYENCAVVALTEGGVLVGEQIAAQLHCVLMMLVTENIDVPGENLSFGAVSQLPFLHFVHKHLLQQLLIHLN